MILSLPIIGIFVVLVGVTFILGQAMSNLQHDPIRSRLAASGSIPVGGNGGTNGTNGANAGLIAGLADQLPQTMSDNGKLARDLLRAGYYHRHARRNYLAIRNSLVLGIVFVAGIAFVGLGPDQAQLGIKIVGGGLLLAATCWSLPRVLLHFAGERRMARISRGLPDALDMLTMCLRGGISIPQSLGHVSREIFVAHPDLAVELYIVGRQSDLSSVHEAFEQLNKRIDSNDVSGFSALVTQAHRLGTNVADAISEYADDLRINKNQLADERANKASVQLVLPVVTCLLPAVFIILWGPAILDMWEFLQGFENVGELPE